MRNNGQICGDGGNGLARYFRLFPLASQPSPAAHISVKSAI
jgi:hypothetical protein